MLAPAMLGKSPYEITMHEITMHEITMHEITVTGPFFGGRGANIVHPACGTCLCAHNPAGMPNSLS
jgi:hypothetical protein